MGDAGEWVANPFIKQFDAIGKGLKNMDPLASASQKRSRHASERAAAAQREAIAKQMQREKIRLMEEESDIAEKRFRLTNRYGGRSLLIATSPSGTSKLGGTNV